MSETAEPTDAPTLDSTAWRPEWVGTLPVADVVAIDGIDLFRRMMAGEAPAPLTAGRRIATAQGRIIGDDGKLYAHGTTTCLIFELDEQ